MAHRDFLIRYSNGFKRHVSKADLLEMQPFLEQTGPREYRCFADVVLSPKDYLSTGPHWLDMQVVFECHGERSREKEQTPRGMIAQLERMGFSPELADRGAEA